MALSGVRTTLFLLISLMFISCQENDPRLAISRAPNLEFERHYDSLLYLPEGWKSTLWAESPQLFNPTNIDVDHRGRIWVTEAVNYRLFKNKPSDHPHFEKGDRVVILEDSDHDGKADKTKVFVQDTDLVAPLGIAVLGNKIVISCAPNLIIYTDDDGDDVPDGKEVMLTGFGGLDHDHSLHAVIAGPDGNWYFNTGNAGPHMVTDKGGWTLRSGSVYTGGTPYNTVNSGARRSDDGRIWVGGLALKIQSDGTGLEVLAHNFRNAYELAIDSYGDLWQNDNDDQVETCRSTWLMKGANAGYFSADGHRTWRADKRPGMSSFEAHWHQSDPGVIPAGDNTGAGSPTGVMVYEGDAFGDKYRGMFINVDAGRNVLFAYQPQMEGAGYSLDRRDLITTYPGSTEGYIWNEHTEDRRKWFRPSDVATGTDGSIYIADWYDPVVGGHLMNDTSAYGRIFRIALANQRLTTPTIDLTTQAGQIEALCSPAINVRNLGFVKLSQAGTDAIPGVLELLKAENPFHRARALWLLCVLGEEGTKVVEDHLRTTADPRLRITAYRALTQNHPSDLLKYARQAARDPSSGVRRAVALSLRDSDYKDCSDILATLYSGFDGDDPWYLEALGTALEGKQDDFFAMIVEKEPTDPLQWSQAFTKLAWRLHPAAMLNAFARRATSSMLPYASRMEALTAIGFVPGTDAAQTMHALADTTSDPRIKKMSSWWLTFRKNNLWHDAMPWESDSTAALHQDVRRWANILLDSSAREEHVLAAVELANHPTGARLLLNMAATEKLPAHLYDHPDLGDALFRNKNQEVRMLAGSYFERSKGVHLSIQKIGELKGEIEDGRDLFSIHCGICHTMGDIGKEIGPDLTNIRGKFDIAGLVDAIINPNAAVTFGYEPTYVTTKKGDIFSGFLLSEGEVTVLKDISGNLHSIQTKEIAEKVIQDNSLMPDPVALNIDEQNVADIIAFLMEH